MSAIDSFLRSHGVEDAAAYLSRFDEGAEVRPANHPLIELRGSIHLMLKRLITRRDVDARFAALKRV